jgi:hypothetical protein
VVSGVREGSVDVSDEHQRPTVPSVVPPSRAQVLFGIFQEATGVPAEFRQQWSDLSDAHKRAWQAVAEADDAAR